MIQQLNYPNISEQRRKHSRIFSRLKRAKDQIYKPPFPVSSRIRSDNLSKNNKEDISNMPQHLSNINHNLEKENLITISNERNLILIKVEKLDLQKCVDCMRKTLINVENDRYTLSWCTFCADKIVLGKFDNNKEILSLDVMDIQNWTDSGSSQIIETPQKNFVVQVLGNK